MRILITGGRDFAREDLIRAFLLRHGPATIVHGACYPKIESNGQRPRVSADWLAHLIAAELGWPEEPYPAHWGGGRAGGPARNLKMVETRPDLVGAFPSPKSRGTWDCVRKAREFGLRVEVFRG